MRCQRDPGSCRILFNREKRKKKISPCEKDLHYAEFSDASKPIEAARHLGEATPSEASQFVDISSEDEAELGEMPRQGTQLEDEKKEIQVSREMMAVMDTLTPRERSILETLIKHGGRMTHTEMRYETSAPKSTLTMVLISLETRNLVTRREWGRTNVIELSERPFFESEHS